VPKRGPAVFGLGPSQGDSQPVMASCWCVAGSKLSTVSQGVAEFQPIGS